MKVLLVSDYATPTGGAELTILSLRDGLRRQGHDARIFASSARPGAMRSFADYYCFGTTSGFRTLLQTFNIWAVQKLHRVIAEFQPDIVHVTLFLTQLSPLILPLLRNIPSLYYVVWYRPICPLGTKRLPNGAICRAPAGKACYQHGCLPLRDWLPLLFQQQLWRRWSDSFNMIVANSEATQRALMAEGIKATEVVWHGVPLQPPRPLLMSPPTAAFAGRLVPEKGADLLLRAFAKVLIHIPMAQLLLAGSGQEEKRLKQRIAHLGLSSKVSMLGHLPRPELEHHLVKAWVQAVPSLWAEPFGMVAAEAMMRGTAVVASNSGGLTEIVRHGETGFLVPTNDVDALAEALVALLDNQALAERMGQAGREVAIARFSEEACLNKFLHLYDTLIINHHPSGLN